MTTQLLKTQLLTVKNMLLILALCAGGFTSHAQTWGTLTTGIIDDLNAVYFNDGNGIAVGANGRVIVTKDRGLTWSIKNSGTVNTFYDAYMFTKDSAYIIGDSGMIYVTGDGGDSWSQITSGTTERLNDIDMNGSEAMIAGNGGTILHISGSGSVSALNSGVTGNLYGIKIHDNQTAIACGGGTLSSLVLVTYNNGGVWLELNTGSLSRLNAAWFINDSTAFVVGNAGTILRTQDYGSNWTSLGSGFSNYNDVHFVNADSGYVVGSTGAIMRTTNGGNTWSALTSGTTNNLNGFSATDKHTMFVAGDGGIVLRTCPYAHFVIMPNDSVCEGTEVTFYNTSINALSYTWLVNGDTVSHVSTYTHTYDSSALYSIRLVADNNTCTSSYTDALYVSEMPEVDLGPDTTICSTCTITLDAGNPGSDYMWYKDGVPTGVVSRTTTVGATGMYKVMLTNPSGCEGMDSVMVTVTTGLNTYETVKNMNIYPNPNEKIFMLTFEGTGNTSEINIVNYLGVNVYHEVIKGSGPQSKRISLDQFAAGVYLVNITSDGHTKTAKMITQ